MRWLGNIIFKSDHTGQVAELDITVILQMKQWAVHTPYTDIEDILSDIIMLTQILQKGAHT